MICMDNLYLTNYYGDNTFDPLDFVFFVMSFIAIVAS